MDVLLSNDATDSMVISTNAPERRPGEVEWSNTAWSAGSIVTRSSTRRVYRAAYDVPSGGVPPEENIAVAQLPFWIDVGAMNQWAMFDRVVLSQTIGPTGSDLVVTFNPGAITTLWLGNIDNANAAHVVVKSKPGGAVVYDQRIELRKKVTNYWDWWFSPFEMSRDAPFQGIPAYRNCEVTLTLETGGTAAIGMAAAGKSDRWGCTGWDVNSSRQRYTPSTANQSWGPAQQGGVNTKDVSYRVFVKPDDAPRVDEATGRAMNRLGVYIPSGDPKFAGIRIFGELIRAEMGYPQPNYVPLDITVREFL